MTPYLAHLCVAALLTLCASLIAFAGYLLGHHHGYHNRDGAWCLAFGEDTVKEPEQVAAYLATLREQTDRNARLARDQAWSGIVKTAQLEKAKLDAVEAYKESIKPDVLVTITPDKPDGQRPPPKDPNNRVRPQARI